jgi:hypothetical protein
VTYPHRSSPVLKNRSGDERPQAGKTLPKARPVRHWFIIPRNRPPRTTRSFPVENGGSMPGEVLFLHFFLEVLRRSGDDKLSFYKKSILLCTRKGQKAKHILFFFYGFHKNNTKNFESRIHFALFLIFRLFKNLPKHSNQRILQKRILDKRRSIP